MLRRKFLPLPLAALAAPAGLKLIAHRGGIVDTDHAENSRASILAAIQRGYWMIEVDIRASRDGEPILQHDVTLERFYGVKHRPEDLSWKELRQLRSNPGGTSPIHFGELCEMAQGKIRLMLDIKNDQMPDDFYASIGKRMQQAGLAQTAFMLGGDKWRRVFGDLGVRESTRRENLERAAAAGENVRERYFLFELGGELGNPSIELTRKLGVECCAAINDFRYVQAKRDTWQGPREDIERLRAGGVTCFQIDSKYESLFL
jgi:glycerophosphoryl diester phosphodiesterase